MTCKHCDDGEGDCIYPYYGLRPHTHDLRGGTFIGSTRIDYSEPLPNNFRPDPGDMDENGNAALGTYTHCPKCGDKEF